ncbi:MAG: beta-ketoacyl-ACP synthase 3 [Deltaproteobacteria bacterium]|nr:beta-ketoacyl-ACP synthase 3 [Deltaproteobacteria bacterium]
MRRACFAGVGAALPSRVVANAEIEDRLGVERGWIERTGIRERRILGADESLVDLAERAVRDALAAASVPPSAVDALVVATTSSAYRFPSLACLLHERLGLRAVPAFDVAAACAGFPYALTVADQGVRAGDYGVVVVVGADCLSAFVDPCDRATAPLFGDGAGAVVLCGAGATSADTAPAAARGILACRLRALGAQWSILTAPLGAPQVASVAAAAAWMHMDGPEVFRVAVEHLVDLTREALAVAGVAPADVALFVPHQANVRIIRMMLQLLRIDESRAMVNLSRYGNTSAASIPIALTEAVREGRLAHGDLVVLNAVGGGITAGAVVARW